TTINQAVTTNSLLKRTTIRRNPAYPQIKQPQQFLPKRTTIRRNPAYPQIKQPQQSCKTINQAIIPLHKRSEHIKIPAPKQMIIRQIRTQL
ncbi:MAG: hypothetical protein LBG17_09695, partial [Bacteroidales bacterium]|nr:hypothetical protein [Bacteroidales bacterium]